jgi:hypothetical protein
MATTLFPVTPTEGVNFNATYTAYNQLVAISPTNSPDNPGPPMQVGTVVKGTGNSEFVFVQASTVINLGDCCLITSATQTAASITTALAAADEGVLVGFAQVPIASGAFGWLQRDGACQNMNVAAATATDGPLNTSAVAGVLTSAAGTLITGAVITATSAGAAVVAGTLNKPAVAVA